MKNTIINFILNVFGYAYIWIEQYKEYPNDDNILGFQIIPEYLPENKLISYKKLTTRIIAIRKTSKD